MNVDPSQKLPDYSDIEVSIFSEDERGIISIGGKKISPELRDVLRDQAKYLKTSQLWEVLSASLTNEAIQLGLLKSTNFDHVQFAKSLWHIRVFVDKVVDKLISK